MHIVRDNINTALPDLCHEITRQGEAVQSRLGETTYEFRDVQLTLTDPRFREVIVPGRKAHLPAQIAETAWVLAGRNDIEFLSHYLPRAKDYSDDGYIWRGAYGPRLRAWGSARVTGLARTTVPGGGEGDQLARVIRILREDPNTRRAIISLADPSIDRVDHQDIKDIPCNQTIQFFVRGGRLDMRVSIRSNDLIWGFSGINQFEWSVLQEFVAAAVGVKVGRATYSIGSLHIYERHLKKAKGLATCRSRVFGHAGWAPPDLEEPVPGFPCNPSVESLDKNLHMFFRYEKQIRSGVAFHLDYPGVTFPLFKQWLDVLRAYWGGVELPGDSRLSVAYGETPKNTVAAPEASPDFLRYVNDLHAKKHEAYGDSWKRRGEQVGILANIARKVDRLGKTDDVETSADTAIDLMVYLAKYRQWLRGLDDGPEGVEKHLTLVNEDPREYVVGDRETLEKYLRESLEVLIKNDWFGEGDWFDEDGESDKIRYVESMLRNAFRLALIEWEASK